MSLQQPLLAECEINISACAHLSSRFPAPVLGWVRAEGPVLIHPRCRPDILLPDAERPARCRALTFDPRDEHGEAEKVDGIFI